MKNWISRLTFVDSLIHSAQVDEHLTNLCNSDIGTCLAGKHGRRIAAINRLVSANVLTAMRSPVGSDVVLLFLFSTIVKAEILPSNSPSNQLDLLLNLLNDSNSADNLIAPGRDEWFVKKLETCHWTVDLLLWLIVAVTQHYFEMTEFTSPSDFQVYIRVSKIKRDCLGNLLEKMSDCRPSITLAVEAMQASFPLEDDKGDEVLIESYAGMTICLTPLERLEEGVAESSSSRPNKHKFLHHLHIESSAWSTFKLRELQTPLADKHSDIREGRLMPSQLWLSQPWLWQAERGVIDALGISSWNSAIGGGVALGITKFVDNSVVLNDVSPTYDRIKLSFAWLCLSETGSQQTEHTAQADGDVPDGLP